MNIYVCYKTVNDEFKIFFYESCLPQGAPDDAVASEVRAQLGTREDFNVDDAIHQWARYERINHILSCEYDKHPNDFRYEMYVGQGDCYSDDNENVRKLVEATNLEEYYEAWNCLEDEVMDYNHYYIAEGEREIQTEYLEDKLLPYLFSGTWANPSHWDATINFETGLDEDTVQEFIEILRDWIYPDISGYVKQLLSNSTTHVAAYPKHPVTGEYFEIPDEYWNEDDAKQAYADLELYFGFDRNHNWESYRGGWLCFYGTLDFDTFKGATHLRVSKYDDNYLAHESGNGSGSCSEPTLTKEPILPCELIVDGSYGYGIDQIYGFCGSAWSEELMTECRAPIIPNRGMAALDNLKERLHG